MQGIAFCVDTLSQHESEELLEKAQLDKLQSQAEELISELVDSDLPENLKAILADHLENLRRSIINYKIWGADGIQRALDLSIATLVRHQNELKKHKDQPVLKKLLGLIAQVDKVVSTVQKVKQLLGPLASYLTGGDIDTLPGP